MIEKQPTELRLILTNDEAILVRSFRACSIEQQEHLFWLALALSKRPAPDPKRAQVLALCDPNRKFR